VFEALAISAGAELLKLLIKIINLSSIYQIMNHYKIFLLFSFTIINVAIGSVPEISPNTFLFCLKPELQPLTISLNRGKPSVGMAELDDYFQTHDVVRIEPWIKSATEMDRDGDIYLNRIYRVYIDENSLVRTNQYISSIHNFSFILYAEPEYIRKPYHTPNDPKYSYQCSLEAVKADLAWDYWDIESGEMQVVCCYHLAFLHFQYPSNPMLNLL
jgi:hypothetical protein